MHKAPKGAYDPLSVGEAVDIATLRCGFEPRRRRLLEQRKARQGTAKQGKAPSGNKVTTAVWDLASSHWEGEWDFQSATRKASGSTRGAARSGEGGASARRGALAGSHSPARVGGAPLPCARHFLWGTFLKKYGLTRGRVVNMKNDKCKRAMRASTGLPSTVPILRIVTLHFIVRRPLRSGSCVSLCVGLVA